MWQINVDHEPNLLNIEKDNNIEPGNGLPKHLFSMASLSFDEGCKFPRLFLGTHTYEGLRVVSLEMIVLHFLHNSSRCSIYYLIFVMQSYHLTS